MTTKTVAEIIEQLHDDLAAQANKLTANIAAAKSTDTVGMSPAEFDAYAVGLRQIVTDFNALDTLPAKLEKAAAMAKESNKLIFAEYRALHAEMTNRQDELRKIFLSEVPPQGKA